MFWKIAIVGIALFVIYKLLTNEKNKKQEDSAKIRERKIAKGELVKDPACHTYVEKENSIKVKDGDKTYYFCSYECRKQFLEELAASGREVPNLPSSED